MKIYVKQKVISWSNSFTVKDEYGDDRWYAKSEIFSLGLKLHVIDADGVERALIRRKLWTPFFPRCTIDINNDQYLLYKHPALFKQDFRLEGTDWRLWGDYTAHEYQLFSGGDAVMRMSKKWFSWGDSYELDIADPGDELLSLCIALSVDMINDSSRNNN